MVFNPQPKPEPRVKKKPKQIKKISSKRAYLLQVYKYKRADFLRHNPNCIVCKNVKASTIHHSGGRQHTIFADKWARDNKISLLIDDRYFLSMCLNCHIKVENNPEWAKENGYSIQRT